MENTSKLMDMQFQSKENFSSVPLLKDFYLFRTNYKKGISNIISGASQYEEEHYRMFDYKYVIQAGNTPVVFQQTVFFIESKNFNFPKFYFYPKSKSAKWFYNLGLFRSKKIITDNKIFNQNYSFRKTDIDDKRFRDVLNPAFFDILNQQKGLYLEGNNFHFIIYYHGELLNHREVKKLFQTGVRFVQNIKDGTGS